MTDNAQKITIINNAFSAGGVESVSRRLSRAFVNLGHDTTLMALSYNPEQDLKKVEDHHNHGVTTKHIPLHLPSLLQWLWVFFYSFILFSRHPKQDRIIIAGIIPAILVLPAIKLFQRQAVTVVNAHTAFSRYMGEQNPVKRTLIKILGNFTLQLADYLANDSGGAADDLKNYFNFNRVETFYNPVCQESDLKLEEPEESAPHLWLKDPELKTFVGCGRFVEGKNFSFMIDVFSELHNQNKNLRLILLGDGPLRATLEQQVKNKNLQGSVEFAGFVSNVKSYMYHADYIWLTSKFEGFSVVLGEALAVGTTPIANDCPFGPREVLKGGEYGCLISGYDLENNVKVIKATLAQTKQPRSYYRERARDFLDTSIAKSYLNADKPK